jgi:hypothetical protein
MDFSLFFPYELHKEIAKFGKVDWLSVSPGENNDYRIDADWHPLAALGTTQRSLSLLASHCKNNQMDFDGATLLLTVRACGVALAQGPKIFYPTAEQWESMEEVELHLPMKDYRQPYPAMVVAIPEPCRQRLSEENDLPLAQCPRCVLLHQDKQGYVFVTMKLGTHCAVPEMSYFFVTNFETSRYEDFEEVLVLRQKQSRLGPLATEAEHGFCNPAARAALNLLLMLTYFGHWSLGPSNPIAHKKHRKNPKLAKYALGDFETIGMKQDIVLRKEIVHKGEPGEPTGTHVRPHWRRGHWRQQRHGAGLALTKLLFISPVLVRADRAVGDMSQSEAVYRGK